MSLKKINKVKINAKLMRAVCSMIGELPEKERATHEGRLHALVRFFAQHDLKPDPDMIQALTARQQALAAFVVSDNIPKCFTAPSPKGMHFIHEAVVDAAAVAPLLFVEEQWAFGSGFRDRILMEMRVEGTA